KRIFDNKKVESHSAIVPTYMKPNGLSADEKIVYNAVKNRFIMQFMPIAEYEESKIVTKVECEEAKGEFVSKGKIQLVEGWRLVEKIESKDTILPNVQENEIVDVASSKVSSVTKKPPKKHTEKTLLRLMETCGKNLKKDNKDEGEDESKEENNSEEMMASILSGFSIGTPATRAETIKKLKDVGYIETKGKSLTCTSLGKTMVEIFPVKELLDLEYTGRLEQTLSDIEKGKFKKSDFLNLIKEFTIDGVNKIKNDTSILKNIKVKLEEGQEAIGNCPVCGNPVIEGEKGFGCSNWKNGCKYTIWKDDKYISSFGKTVSKEMIELLLKNGKVGFRNLKSKKGNTFSAYFRYELNKETGYFNWKIEFI
ncbi:MAG: DNA topoisomerase, partial [Clostridium sp.]|uniref:type IA DNA topoisomerase n=1 Tax=Clostridium sp. TaxID=1506 RepID=UPI003F2A0535